MNYYAWNNNFFNFLSYLKSWFFLYFIIDIFFILQFGVLQAVLFSVFRYLSNYGLVFISSYIKYYFFIFYYGSNYIFFCFLSCAKSFFFSIFCYPPIRTLFCILFLPKSCMLFSAFQIAFFSALFCIPNRIFFCVLLYTKSCFFLLLAVHRIIFFLYILSCSNLYFSFYFIVY